MSVTEQLRTRVRTLLHDGVIDLFVGYRQGANPLRIAPLVVTRPDAAARLVWSPFCAVNLATTLRKHAGRRAGILAKGCDARALIELLRLNQIRREQLYIVGVACTGLLNPAQVAAHCDPATISAVTLGAASVTLAAGPTQTTWARDDLLVAKCRSCPQPTPLDYDELLGAAEATPTGDPAGRFAAATALEARDTAARRAYWEAHLGRCTLCYACQTICPVCFCKECPLTLERDDPQRKQPGRAAIFAFHLMRASHMAERCTGCYECERVCPAAIPLSALVQKIEQMRDGETQGVMREGDA